MIDWFIILTPILLLPIALLFFFVGCYTAGDFVFASFRINCYLENVRLGHNFEIRIYDSGTMLYREETEVHNVIEGGGVASQVRFQLAERLPPGRATLSCQVIDRTTGELLVDKGDAPCEGDFEVGEAYDFVFNAGISDDGMEPDTIFDECTPFPR